MSCAWAVDTADPWPLESLYVDTNREGAQEKEQANAAVGATLECLVTARTRFVCL